jgi:hypothetical protein
MTQLEVVYHYGVAPSQSALLALNKIRDVYGVRRMELRESDKIIRIEYDASRLTAAVIQQLLRRADINLVETLPSISQSEEIATPDLG